MKPIHPLWRVIILSGGGLSLVAGIQLLLLPEQTDVYFTWTIQSPLTAAIIGAFFFGTLTFGIIAFREQAAFLARMLVISVAGSLPARRAMTPLRG
jgi:hypothetical protein